MKDPIVEKVRNDLHTRSQAGIKKYGTTLAGNKGDHLYWLQHAYEEALDMALYLKRAIEEEREEKSIGKQKERLVAFIDWYFKNHGCPDLSTYEEVAKRFLEMGK
jgi:hypothetical protein